MYTSQSDACHWMEHTKCKAGHRAHRRQLCSTVKRSSGVFASLDAFAIVLLNTDAQTILIGHSMLWFFPSCSLFLQYQRVYVRHTLSMAPEVHLNICILWIAYLLWYDTYQDLAIGSTAGSMLYCALWFL